MIRRRLLFGCAAAMLLLAWTPEDASAQALSNVRIGDDAASLAARTPAPSSTAKAHGVTMSKWVFENGNELSATTSGAGKVVYVEADWGGRVDGAVSDFAGLRFGETTLKDLRAKFRSNGMAFRGRSPTMRVPDGTILMNSYEVGGAIVTFITKVADADIATIKPQELAAVLAEHAKLDAISLASPDYAERTWGEAVYDTNYKTIEWE